MVLPVLLCLASGFVLADLAWSRRGLRGFDLLFRMFLAAGFGLGIFSVVFLLSRVFGISKLVWPDVGVFALLLTAFVFVRTNTTSPNLKVAPARSSEPWPVWLHGTVTVALAIALCAALYSAFMRTVVHPHGDGWDAFSIWNLHARFLFRGGSRWHDGFTPLLSWSHPDYPLLLPAAIAHFWSYLGHDSPLVPAIIGLMFTFSTVGLLFSALAILRGQMQAMLGSIALLATPAFIEQGSSQYADVPLAFMYLATVALLCLYDDPVEDGTAHPAPRLLVVAGIAAAFAAWTKNEGQLFLCAVVVARLFVLICSRARRGGWLHADGDGWASLSPLLLVVAPALVLIACFKHFLLPPGYLFSDASLAIHKLSDVSRYRATVQWFAKEFFRFGRWLLIPGTLLTAGFYVAAGRSDDNDYRLGLRTSVLALALTLAGYFAVYLITPYDIYWHLRFSLNRLFLQLWPSTIFLLFLAVKCRSHNGLPSTAPR